MADIFRGPLFSNKRDFAPVLGVTALAVSSLLTTTLAVILALPPGFQSLPAQIQHPGHAVALNQDSTCDSPITLRADAQLPFFVAPSFGPNAKSNAGWLPADTSQETGKALTQDKQAPVFVAAYFSPNAAPRWIPTETSLKQQITLQTIVAPPPIVPTVYLSPLRFWWMPDDSSSGIAKVAFADSTVPIFVAPQFQVDRLRPVTDSSRGTPKGLIADAIAPFQSQPYTVDPEVRRWVVDTSLGTATPLRTVVAPPIPPGLSAHIPVQRGTWPVVDTSRGTPKGLTADAARPFPSTPQFAIGRQFPIRDTSVSTALPLRTVVPPPFVAAVWLQVERPQQVVARSFINTPPALLPGILDLSRIYTVSPVDRTFSIGPFVRTYTVVASNRTYTITARSYNLTVSGPG